MSEQQRRPFSARYEIPLPPVDPRTHVRVCCGDTHWGPEPIDYPCPEAVDESGPEENLYTLEVQVFATDEDLLRAHDAIMEALDSFGLNPSVSSTWRKEVEG